MDSKSGALTHQRYTLIIVYAWQAFRDHGQKISDTRFKQVKMLI